MQEMYFEKELVQIEEKIPYFSVQSNVKSFFFEKNEDLDKFPNYKCPVCGSYFINLVSLIKVCSKHLPDLEKLAIVLVYSFNGLKKDYTRDLEYNCGSLSENFKLEGNPNHYDRKERKRETLKTSNKESRSSVKKLPKDYFYFCPTCNYATGNYICYRDHLMGHEDPSVKCCKICNFYFSAGKSAKRHKKTLHPEMYYRELTERTDKLIKNGPKRVIYYTIHKSKVTKAFRKDRTFGLVGTPNGKCKTEKNPKGKSCNIVVDRLSLPGFLCNDWFSLPKEQEQRWNAKPKQVKKEKSEDDFSWPIIEQKTRKKTNNPVKNKLLMVQKTEKNEHESLSKHKEDYGDDFEWPMNGDFNKSPINVESEISTVTSPIVQNQTRLINQLLNKKSSNILKRGNRITPEEIPNIPQFIGAKYLFNVYKTRRQYREKLYKIRKRLGLIMVKKRDKTKINDPDNERKIMKCLICNATRNVKSIRRHVAIHYFEEDETICRICAYSQCDRTKMKQHYSKNHNINFQEYLMKHQKNKMETGTIIVAENPNYVTCSICFSNMKSEEHLKYHIEILHNYTIHGGSKRKKMEGTDCILCDAKFKKTLYLRKHVRRCHKEYLIGGNEAVICHHCGKQFQTKGDFRSHFWHSHRNRDDGKPQRKTKTPQIDTNIVELTICEMCGELLYSKRQITNHKCDKKNFGVRDQSKKVFGPKSKQDCIDHQQITDFSSAFCEFCNKKFVSPYNFKLHVRTYNEEVFYCNFSECGKSFTSKLWFRRHLKVHELQKIVLLS